MGNKEEKGLYVKSEYVLRKFYKISFKKRKEEESRRGKNIVFKRKMQWLDYNVIRNISGRSTIFEVLGWVKHY